MSCCQARVRAMRGGAVRKERAIVLGAEDSVLCQGIIWRHSHSVRFRWRRGINDLRRVESGRWCEAAVQTLRF